MFSNLLFLTVPIDSLKTYMVCIPDLNISSMLLVYGKFVMENIRIYVKFVCHYYYIALLYQRVPMYFGRLFKKNFIAQTGEYDSSQVIMNI